MRIKTFLIIISALILLSNRSGAFSAPTINESDTARIYTNTGLNQILIPLTGSLPDESPEIQAVTDTTLLSVIQSDYLPGSSFVLITVR